MSKTTRAAQDALLAKRRQAMTRIGQQFPTEFTGARVTVVAYDAATDRYRGASGLWWQLVDGVMVAPEEEVQA
jgi:hypothetical protein